MKRLKNKLLAMEPGETGFAAIYEGSMAVPTPNGPEMHYDSTYWRNDIGYEFTRTHKLALDKPTVTIKIPACVLGMEGCGDRKTAADYCLRAFTPYAESLNAELNNRSRPDNENGKYCVYSPGGEVLARNSCFLAVCPQKYYENGGGILIYPYSDGAPLPPLEYLCIRIQVQLPRKKIRKTIQMLTRDLPGAVELFAADFDTDRLAAALALARKQAAVREWLKASRYCAFIANGSILPRSKGTQLPMENAVPFLSVPEDEIEIEGVRGMGIRRGVTVITGGGYSGKTTLLDAISAGIYDHVAGDGRELCITDDTAVKISAEDGRSVKSLNISPFLGWIPGGDTRNFSTERASGSTSQAANIMEGGGLRLKAFAHRRG